MNTLPEKIVCIGAGYVGGPTMAVIAERCPAVEVTVLDHDAGRIAAWNSDRLPVFEPGLAEIVGRARGRNLRFVEQQAGLAALAEADVVFISVQTPTKTEGEGVGKASDLRYVEACARFIAEHARGHTIVVEKSTMPVRAAERIQQVLATNRTGATFTVLSNPEFLAEGTAIRDLVQPDRVLIGGEDAAAVAILQALYAAWVPSERILTTGLWSAELSKLAANAFLAQRVSSINSLSALCERTGAEIAEVAAVVGTDSRIGPKFLKASVGFGGSCFQKDLLSLVYLCEHHGLPEVAAYWQQVVDLNEWQKSRFAAEVAAAAKNRRVAVLGLAFKKDTNDFRESAALQVIRSLLRSGCEVIAYDPRVDGVRFATELGVAGGFTVAASAQQALAGVGAVAVLTEWDEFRTLPWRASALASGATVFDGRGIVDRAAVRQAGLGLRVIGSPAG
jgi:UDPglucose 6-dehydrogenase